MDSWIHGLIELFHCFALFLDVLWLFLKRGCMQMKIQQVQGSTTNVLKTVMLEVALSGFIKNIKLKYQDKEGVLPSQWGK